MIRTMVQYDTSQISSGYISIQAYSGKSYYFIKFCLLFVQLYRYGTGMVPVPWYEVIAIIIPRVGRSQP